MLPHVMEFTEEPSEDQIPYDLPHTLPPLRSKKEDGFLTGEGGSVVHYDPMEDQPDCSSLKSLPYNQHQQAEFTPDFLINDNSSSSTSDDDNKSLGGSSPFSLQSRSHPSPKEDQEDSLYPLPLHKDYHVFITHSTGDFDLVNNKLIHPLMNSKLKVTSSFAFKEGGDYNNDAIKHAMRRSCSILIGISESYRRSERYVLLTCGVSLFISICLSLV